MADDTYDPMEPYDNFQQLPRAAVPASDAANAANTSAAAVVASGAPGSGHKASNELLAVQIPVPILDFDEKVPPHIVTRRVRGFLRDVENLFELASWGRLDQGRRLFLANSLKGLAKAWHDDWSYANKGYTSQSLLTALQARFAPQILSREMEARDKLDQGKHTMRHGETLSSYQSRFESILADLPLMHDSEKVYWFLRDLSATLVGQCATDFQGNPFSEYSALVQHARGEELRMVAAKRVRATAQLHSVVGQEDDSSLEHPRKRKKSRPTPPSVAAIHPGGARAEKRKNVHDRRPDKRTGFPPRHKELPKETNRRHGRDAAIGVNPYVFKMDSVGLPGDRLSLAQYQHYRKHYLCFGCGSDEHLFSQCPKNPNRDK